LRKRLNSTHKKSQFTKLESNFNVKGYFNLLVLVEIKDKKLEFERELEGLARYLSRHEFTPDTGQISSEQSKVIEVDGCIVTRCMIYVNASS
jgi:hypothetical protein